MDLVRSASYLDLSAPGDVPVAVVIADAFEVRDFMDQATFSTLREYFDMVHGVTVKAIDAFTDADLDFRPKPDMRSPRELIFHVYSQQKILAEAAREGRFTAEAASGSSPEEPAVATQLQAMATVGDLRAYAEACHQPRRAYFRLCRKAS